MVADDQIGDVALIETVVQVLRTLRARSEGSTGPVRARCGEVAGRQSARCPAWAPPVLAEFGGNADRYVDAGPCWAVISYRLIANSTRARCVEELPRVPTDPPVACVLTPGEFMSNLIGAGRFDRSVLDD